MTRYIPDEQIDEALREIDSIAREFDHYEYGLPLGDIDDGRPHAKMRDVIRGLLSITAPQGKPIGEIVRSFSNGSGLDVHLFGKLTSDTPGIVGTKLYAAPAVPSDEQAEFERAYNRLFRGRGVDTRHISDCEAVWMARAAIPTASYVHDQGSLIHGPE